MANKNSVAERRFAQAKTKFTEEGKKLRRFHLIGAIGLLLVLLSFFFTFAEIYNTTEGVGVEVRVRGFSFLMAGLTGKFTATDGIYGDLAVPFYYYAKEWCEIISTLTLVAGIIILATIILKVLACIFNVSLLTYITAVLETALTVLVVIVFIKALDMNNSQILPVYCSGNPACSIKSYAIIPAIVSLLVVVFEWFIVYKTALNQVNYRKAVKGATAK